MCLNLRNVCLCGTIGIMYATPVEATLTEIHTSLIKWFNYNFSLMEMTKSHVADFYVLKNSVHLM